MAWDPVAAFIKLDDLVCAWRGIDERKAAPDASYENVFSEGRSLGEKWTQLRSARIAGLVVYFPIVGHWASPLSEGPVSGIRVEVVLGVSFSLRMACPVFFA